MIHMEPFFTSFDHSNTETEESVMLEEAVVLGITFHPMAVYLISGTLGFVCHFTYFIYALKSNSIFAESFLGYSFILAPAFNTVISLVLLSGYSAGEVFLAAIFSQVSWIFLWGIVIIVGFAKGYLD